LSAIIQATRWNYNAKFYALITCLYLHTEAKRHLVLSYCSVYILRDNLF